jgi:hypothetical protein
MPLEAATYLSGLNASNPVGATDPKSQGDDHLRLIKSTLLNTFPNLNAAVTSDPTELNLLDGITGFTGTGTTLVKPASPTFTGTITAAAITASGIISGIGSGLTALNATQLTSGSVPDARVPSSNVTQHVALINHNSLLNYEANRHIDHSGVTLTAGSGLTGGGTIAASRSFAIDLSGLAQYAATDVAGADEFLVLDGGTNKAARWQDMGLPITTTSAAATPTDADTNRGYILSGGTDRAFTLNTGIGAVGNFILLGSSSTAKWTLAGTATLIGALGTAGMRDDNSVICLLCIAANTWLVFGDAV